MKITVLGSGSFFIDKDHSAPGYLLQTGKKNILLDCGPGTLVQLAKIGFDPLDLDYIFVSHFHNDHTSDLVSILIRPFILEEIYKGNFDKKITVIGPESIYEFVKAMAMVCKHKFVEKYEKIEYIDAKKQMEFDEFIVNCFFTNHIEEHSIGYRFDFPRTSLAYTGDAMYSESIAQDVAGVDLLIADTSVSKNVDTKSHMSSTQVGNICRDGGVKKVILSHQVPPVYNTDMASEVREVFDGEVVLAKDLMEINL